ncbi:hypothetical protein ACQU0X_21075 [Pseudovibrio ascidiaceicola]
MTCASLKLTRQICAVCPIMTMMAVPLNGIGLKIFPEVMHLLLLFFDE